MPDISQPPTSPEDIEVRRCRCGKATAIPGRVWTDGGILGLAPSHTPTGERDFVCQSCGFVFTILPPGSRILGLAFSGIFLSGALMGCVGGLLAGLSEGNFAGMWLALVFAAIASPIVYWSTASWRLRRRHPVVPDAPIPSMVFGLREASRKCACGGTAVCTEVLQWRKLGINLGRDVTFRCTGCQRAFTVTSWAGMVFTTFATSVALALGFGLMTKAPGEGAFAWICSGSIALLGIGGLVLVVVRLVARFRNPSLPRAAKQTSRN